MSTMKFTSWQDLDGNEVANSAYPPGLVLVKQQTIGSAVSSVTVNNAFNDNFDNYQIVVSSKTSQNAAVRMSLDGVAGSTDYDSTAFFIYVYSSNAGTWNESSFFSGSSWNIGWSSTLISSIVINLFGVRSDSRINYYSNWSSYVSGFCAGRSTPTSGTQSSNITILPTAGAFNGGTIRVYGYNQ